MLDFLVLVTHASSQSYWTVSEGGGEFQHFINRTVWRQTGECSIPKLIIANILGSLHTHGISEFTLSGKGSLKRHRLQIKGYNYTKEI
ncbi:unnamed protein product [Allacma fusca]|uniref:Uncharacterized protein n=1 Tax=Allacma fusca TaxID=39272 RepID=A0A8J2KGF1_9HEXA|nr:unnamed protein product [Allacma fusca]